MIGHALAVILGVMMICSARYSGDFRQSGEHYGWYALGSTIIFYAIMRIIEGRVDLGDYTGFVDQFGTFMLGILLGMLTTIFLIDCGRKRSKRPANAEQSNAG